jgi:cysteinyl-tRNA synthetase
VRIEVDEDKEDPRDFVLWKAAKSNSEASWPSPWGEGRPGWHIECSAMSKACLGESFDIHGGGPDLLFPHHENEIAQSEAANGCQFVNYWLHAGAVRTDGRKMSKSENNFFTIRDALKEYHPEVIRYLMISTHYRSHINYSESTLIEARVGLERFYITLKEFDHVPLPSNHALVVSDYYKRFIEAMNDDFNTRVALAVMYDIVKTINIAIKESEHERALSLAGELIAIGNILGILQADATLFLQSGYNTELSVNTVNALPNAIKLNKLRITAVQIVFVSS